MLAFRGSSQTLAGVHRVAALANGASEMGRTQRAYVCSVGTSRLNMLSASFPVLTDTVEKGFWGRSLSNIDSRSNATAQSRFKNLFVRLRLFQILIPQLHFGDFFNNIDP